MGKLAVVTVLSFMVYFYCRCVLQLAPLIFVGANFAITAPHLKQILAGVYRTSGLDRRVYAVLGCRPTTSTTRQHDLLDFHLLCGFALRELVCMYCYLLFFGAKDIISINRADHLIILTSLLTPNQFFCLSYANRTTLLRTCTSQ